MTTHGLLIEDHQGQHFLLTTKPCTQTKTHRLVVLQRIDDRWVPVRGRITETCRELIIDAVMDFFLDIHKVLNSSGKKSRITPGRSKGPRRPRIRATGQPNRWAIR